MSIVPYHSNHDAVEGFGPQFPASSNLEESEAIQPNGNDVRAQVPTQPTPQSKQTLPPGPTLVPHTECMLEESEECEDLSVLNRIREVREQQGVSIRSMSRRMGLDIRTCRKLEDPERDLTLSELQMIQQALDVPLQDLLVDRQSLSRPVEERAKMIRIMKTAVALRELKVNTRANRMAEMLCEQLVDIMPELAEVSGWPQFGARRGKSALGRVLAQQIDMSQLMSE